MKDGLTFRQFWRVLADRSADFAFGPKFSSVSNWLRWSYSEVGLVENNIKNIISSKNTGLPRSFDEIRTANDEFELNLAACRLRCTTKVRIFCLKNRE